jgi:hypothetical protein
MANTFTNLVKAAYKSFDVISHELIGFVNSVTLDAEAAAIPVGQTLYSFKTPASVSTTITPGVTPPDDGDQVIASKSLSIETSKRVPIRWTGEEAVAIGTGAGYEAVKAGQVAQAFRTLANEMESFVYLKAAAGASRAFGTAGTTPFATTLEDAAQIRKILDDNGAPGARSLVINTTAALAMRKLTVLTKANEAGSTMTLRDGELLDLFGLSIKESAAVVPITAGTGSGYLSNLGATLAVGSTAIITDTGSGTVLAGDVVTFAGDTNKYVVASSVGGASVTLVTIQSPGLKQTLANNVAMTIGAAYTGNVGFSQSAIVLAARTPYFHAPGDAKGELAINEEIVTDPYSGLSFRLAQYANYGRTQYEVSAAWGATVFNPEHVALMLG